jgi:hypothetical protein
MIEWIRELVAPEWRPFMLAFGTFLIGISIGMELADARRPTPNPHPLGSQGE